MLRDGGQCVGAKMRVWDRWLRSVKHGAEMGVRDRPVNKVDAVSHLVMKKFHGFLFVRTG
ncbi:hypothetical protein KC19_11G065300 [Ceratodon purpureus]|uniref:Uncharacterized protein n=1 Tax=Ceratodon purpureus TaxID=3225 RepID=A0A8T0GEN3_CERPU|nr:hypothetical protein KC19_11G065300 [Ceratodon purpureus]